jgi:hypothetical protein
MKLSSSAFGGIYRFRQQLAGGSRQQDEFHGAAASIAAAVDFFDGSEVFVTRSLMAYHHG